MGQLLLASGTSAGHRDRQCAVARKEEEKGMKVIEKADVAPIEPLLCSIEAGTAIIGRSKRFIIDAIARGQLQAVKSDRRTLLVVQSLKDYVAGLPPAKGTKNPRRHVV
jgi:hypothetical protein